MSLGPGQVLAASQQHVRVVPGRLGRPGSAELAVPEAAAEQLDVPHVLLAQAEVGERGAEAAAVQDRHAVDRAGDSGGSVDQGDVSGGSCKTEEELVEECGSEGVGRVSHEVVDGAIGVGMVQGDRGGFLGGTIEACSH